MADRVLDLDALIEQERDGITLGGVLYPWAMIGPIEQARYGQLTKELNILLGFGDDDDTADGTVAAEQPPDDPGDDGADIADIARDLPDPMSEEDATQMVRIQRDMVRLVLPTLPEEVLAGLHDAFVGDILDFFGKQHTLGNLDRMEQQMESLERANELGQRARKIGGRLSRRSRGSTGATRPRG